MLVQKIFHVFFSDLRVDRAGEFSQDVHQKCHPQRMLGRHECEGEIPQGLYQVKTSQERLNRRVEK